MKVGAYLLLLFQFPYSLNCQISGIEKIKWGKRMKNVLINSMLQISFMDCVEECISRKRCRSLNYQRRNLLCELNSDTSYLSNRADNSSADAFEDDTSFVFTEMTAWDKIAGECSTNPCQINEKCTRKSSGDVDCNISDCGPLPEMKNTTEVSEDIASIIKIGVGARRAVKCNRGFLPIDKTSYVVCMSSGEWHGILECQACECGCYRFSIPDSINIPYTSSLGGFLVTIPILHENGHYWRIIQRRKNGHLDFSKTWCEYKNGFGSPDPDEELWIGNENIHLLTSAGYTHLMIKMTDFNERLGFAEYSSFRVLDESQSYSLMVSGFRGNVGDSFSYHNDQQFTTYDQDNDKATSGNCAKWYGGGWWYKGCIQSNLNGKYSNYNVKEGVVWQTWTQSYWDWQSLKTVVMMIRKP